MADCVHLETKLTEQKNPKDKIEVLLEMAEKEQECAKRNYEKYQRDFLDSSLDLEDRGSLIKLCFEIGLYEEVLKHVDKIFTHSLLGKSSKIKPGLLFKKIAALFLLERYKETGELLEEALKDFPDDPYLQAFQEFWSEKDYKRLIELTELNKKEEKFCSCIRLTRRFLRRIVEKKLWETYKENWEKIWWGKYNTKLEELDSNKDTEEKKKARKWIKDWEANVIKGHYYLKRTKEKIEMYCGDGSAAFLKVESKELFVYYKDTENLPPREDWKKLTKTLDIKPLYVLFIKEEPRLFEEILNKIEDWNNKFDKLIEFRNICAHDNEGELEDMQKINELLSICREFRAILEEAFLNK